MNDSDKGKPEWTGLAWRLENNYIPTNLKKEHTEYINNGSRHRFWHLDVSVHVNYQKQVL